MPNKDGTGPEGKGSRTGREMGNCEGANPRGMGLGRGMGGGFRRGRGFGFRRRAFNQYPVRSAYESVMQPVTLTKDEQKEILEAELEDIKTDVKEIETEKQEIMKKLKELK